MQKKTIESIGVVVELEGKYWGVTSADGHSTSYGFGPIENAEVSDPRYCTKATDVTWNPHWPEPNSRYNPDYETLKGATLRKIKITKTYEVEDAQQDNAE